MIHGVFGKLGAGKGLYLLDIIARELMDGFRDVVTNVPLRLIPWINGQGIPQIGLRQYLIEKLAPLPEEDIDEILKRVYVNENIDDGHDLYLWRRDGETNEWFKLEITVKDEKGRPARFDANEIKKRHCAPCLVVIDEAWAFFPNSGGYNLAPVLTFYSKQQRKLRDECYICTQHPTDCSEVFWKIAQDFHVCRNHGMERIGFFRQPSVFRVIVYLTNPAKGNAIKSHEITRFLDKRLCQCYDTTAGVGFSGGHKGDANQKRGGLHIAWLIGGIVLVVVGLAFIPYVLSHATRPFLTRTLSGGRIGEPKKEAVVVPVQSAVNLPSQSLVQVQAATPAVVQNPSQAVYCTGFMFLNGLPRAFLSDGTSVESPELQTVARNYVVVSGVKMPIVLGHSYVSESVSSFSGGPQPVAIMPSSQPANYVGQSPAVRPPSVQVWHMPADHRQLPPRLNGFASMAQ